MKINKKYYNGYPLITRLDINREKPSIFISTGNKSAGKTTFFNYYFLERFLKYEEHFIILERYKYLTEGASERFMNALHTAGYFTDLTMEEQRSRDGIYTQLFIGHEGENDFVPCGKVIALSQYANIKKTSSSFMDETRILFDEFQSEDHRYLANETQAFHTVHTAIARGGGAFIRYIPVFMISNIVSILNPYFLEFRISERLKNDTKFLRGPGWVLEQTYNPYAAEAQKEANFNRAFMDNDKIAKLSENIYFDKNSNFVNRGEGKFTYIATILYHRKNYGVRYFYEKGVVEISPTTEKTRNLFAMSGTDFAPGYILINEYDPVFTLLRKFFKAGKMCFKTESCKNAILGIMFDNKFYR